MIVGQKWYQSISPDQMFLQFSQFSFNWSTSREQQKTGSSVLVTIELAGTQALSKLPSLKPLRATAMKTMPAVRIEDGQTGHKQS